MRAKTVNESFLHDIPNWIYIASALFFLYKFFKGHLKYSRSPQGIKRLQDYVDESEQRAIKIVKDSIKLAIIEKAPIKYSEDIVYHIFEYSTLTTKKDAIPNFMIKINKENRTLIYSVKEGFNQYPLKLSDEQYNEFLRIVNKINK
jgi:hypothetical protein